jgi:hypothetical protein
MNKIVLLALLAIAVTNYRCTSPAKQTTGTPSFSYTIEEDNSFTGLPALQSFVFGESDSCWLMFGGRTNGFHNFYQDQNFPYKKANTYIYVYNKYTHKLDSMSIYKLPAILSEQFAATNMQNRQVDNYLYLTGGYGMINQGQPDSNWVTHNIMSRVNISQMISAVQNQDSVALGNSVKYFINDLVRATGGELYKLPDGKFYLCVGHNFNGPYSAPVPNQIYLKQVRAFELVETDSSITMLMPINILSDNLNDSFSQFRRRDLVVAPNVGAGGNSYGISIYGGVFTLVGTNPLRNPIYITGGAQPAYTIDSAFTQASNIYSAPNLQLYDSLNDIMITTIFGGIGDTLYPGGDNASFTKLVINVLRNNKTNVTSATYNPTALPQYVGAEGVFIRAANMPLYQNNSSKLGIMNYNSIPTNTPTTIGYIYGGILSNANESDSSGNPTIASGKVYKVTITKK